MSDLGIVIDKDAVHDILQRLDVGGFSAGDLGIEQATNAICRLQRPPGNLHEAALTVVCPYCGRTPGNQCQRAGSGVDPHPSRVAAAFS